MSEQRSKKRIAVIIILAFVLPILVLLAVMAICGVIPFGSKSTFGVGFIIATQRLLWIFVGCVSW